VSWAAAGPANTPALAIANAAPLSARFLKPLTTLLLSRVSRRYEHPAQACRNLAEDGKGSGESQYLLSDNRYMTPWNLTLC
jgi:hypothetical protein